MGFAIFEHKRAAVGFSDLAAEDQSDAGTVLLCSKERHEQIGGRWQARAFVINRDLEACRSPAPADIDSAAGLQRCIDGITNQIDQQLVQ